MKQSEDPFCDTQGLIEELRAGRQIILTDDENRENEGDLVIAAEFADANAINFMAKYGRGLICLTLTAERAEALELPLMTGRNQARHHTNFTVSIEAREGVTTGISAYDRSLTIQTAINDQKNARDLVSPGHVFPLIARNGGVLIRTGHTEAACDLARLAGLKPFGVICEIMRDDGEMARRPDLIVFAKQHGLKMGAIADLVAYRRRYDHLLKLKYTRPLQTDYAGEFLCKVYENTLDGSEHIALIKGDPSNDEPIHVRMHALNSFEDIIGICAERYRKTEAALKEIHRIGRGVCILLRDHRPDALGAALEGIENPKSSGIFKEYGLGAQILTDLKIKNMILLTNSEPGAMPGLAEGYGLNITGHAPLPDLSKL